jgi:hypothetical protein
MTTNKHLKRLVRSRAARTGEPYATALRNIRQEQETRMSTNALSTEGMTTSCSFCGKPNTEVERLVAGPGVFICNECVELALVVVEDAASATPEESTRWRAARQDPSTEDLLTMLPALVKSADRVELELATSVNRMRERGVAWHTIADAAGLSVDATRQRFGKSGVE